MSSTQEEVPAQVEEQASTQKEDTELKESDQEKPAEPSDEVPEAQETEADLGEDEFSSEEDSEPESDAEEVETELYMNVRYGTVHKVTEGPAAEDKNLFVCGRSNSTAFVPLPLSGPVGARCCQRCFAAR